MFSPIVKLVIVKLPFSLTAIFQWSIMQLDVSNAFLREDILDEVYMELPQGYACSKGEPLPPNAIC